MATQPSDAVGTRLIFEYERPRVWELALAPGESLATHVHRLNYVFIVESGGLIRFVDPDNPGDHRDVPFEDGQATFVPAPDAASGQVDNRLTTIGMKHHHNHVIELKPG